MTSSSTKTAYRAGIRDGLPFIFMAIPAAMLFGVVASDAGLKLGETIGFSVLVIAGASQFAAVQLMVEDAAIAFVILGALAVNLRMAMYAAALTPHLGAAPMWQRFLMGYMNMDQTYMQSLLQYERKPQYALQEKVWYFFGVATPLFWSWWPTTIIGYLIGAAIPPEYALDFIIPIMFLSMVATMIRTFAHVCAACTSAIVGLLLWWMPSGSGLLIAAVCAMIVGAAVETWQEKRA